MTSPFRSRSTGPRALGPDCAGTLDRLTAGLGLPGKYGILMSREIGDAREGASAVDAEYLDDRHFRVTRYVELAGERTEDPDVNDRVADPQVDFLRQDGAWFPLAATSRIRNLREHDVHAIAEAMLRDVACEHDLGESAGRRALLGRLATILWALVRDLTGRQRRALS